MSSFPASKLPYDPERLDVRRDARATLAAYQAFLQDPAFANRIDMKVLTRIAGDEKMPPRERRRAAEMIGNLYLKALDKVSDLSCVREQVLMSLGIDPSPRGGTNVAVDARSVTIEADRDALRELLRDPQAADLAAALARRLDGRSRDDGAPSDPRALPDPAASGAALQGGSEGGANGGAAPGANAAASREERDVQRLGADVVPQHLAGEEGDAGVV
jgi:hypothetical protein